MSEELEYEEHVHINIKKDNNTKSKFEWKIPAASQSFKEIICAGYTRNNYDKHMIHEIIQLFAQFYSTDLHSVKQILSNTSYRPRYTSPIFSMYNNTFRYYLELRPNGYREANQGEVELFVCLIPGMNIQLTLTAHFVIQFLEVNLTATPTRTLDSNNWYFMVPFDRLFLKDIQYLESITFTLDIELLNQYLPKINPKLYINLPPIEYIWEIDDESLLSQIQNAPNVHFFVRKIPPLTLPET